MVTLTDGTIKYHHMYDNGSNEAFVIHVQEVLNFCKNKGFYKAFAKAKVNLQDCTTRFNMAKDKLVDAKNDPTTPKDRMKALVKSQELASTAVILATKALPRRGNQFFSLYKLLLCENARVKWWRIVKAQIGAANWTYLQVNVQETPREHSVESFKNCVKFHLLLVFAHDAGEQQKYYISHNLKKPRKIPLRNFADRLEQLNSYIPILPGVINSPQCANMKRAVALDEAKLAHLLIQLVPQAQQNQYQLIN